jgi:hypothetical protein
VGGSSAFLLEKRPSSADAELYENGTALISLSTLVQGVTYLDQKRVFIPPELGFPDEGLRATVVSSSPKRDG